MRTAMGARSDDHRECPGGEGVAEALRCFLRAVRTLRTYPADNEMSRQALARATPALQAVLPLDLDVGTEFFSCSGQPIPLGEEDRFGVAASLFRDGVRRLELREGLDAGEVERLVLALAETIHADDLSQDYVTRIWEADLDHVSVCAVDPYLELDTDEEVLEGKAKPMAEAAPREVEEVPPPPPEAFRLSEADRLRIAQEATQADSTAPWGPFLQATFAALLSPTGVRRVDEVVLLVESMWHRCLSTGRWKLAAELLQKLRGKLPRAALAPLRGALGRMARAERLAPLHERLEAGQCDPGEAASLLRLLGPLAGPALCELIQSAREEHAVRVYADVLASIGPPALPQLIPLLSSGPQQGRARAARVLGRIQHPEAMAALLKALEGAQGVLRRDLVRGLALQASEAAERRLLDAALEDPDPAVRVIALRDVGRFVHSGAGARSRILERIRSRGSRAADPEERDLLFAALGRVGGIDVVPFLARLLRPGWLRRSRREDWRRAARALGGISTPQAREVLERSAERGPQALAALCIEALREMPRTSS